MPATNMNEVVVGDLVRCVTAFPYRLTERQYYSVQNTDDPIYITIRNDAGVVSRYARNRFTPVSIASLPLLRITTVAEDNEDNYEFSSEDDEYDEDVDPYPEYEASAQDSFVRSLDTGVLITPTPRCGLAHDGFHIGTHYEIMEVLDGAWVVLHSTDEIEPNEYFLDYRDWNIVPHTNNIIEVDPNRGYAPWPKTKGKRYSSIRLTELKDA